MALVFHKFVLIRFARSVFVVILLILAISFLVNFAEINRRYWPREAYSFFAGVRLSAMVSLFWHDKIIPFAFVIGAVVGFVDLSRRSELIVARANGISVWGILLAPLAFAFLFGLVSVFLLAPLTVDLKERSDKLRNQIRAVEQLDTDASIWLRQTGPDGTSIMQGRSFDADDLVMVGAAAFVFDEDRNLFRQKITARSAQFSARDRSWIMRDAIVTSPDANRARYEAIYLASDLSAKEVRQLLTQPEALTLVELPRFIATAEAGGLKTERFRFALNELIARPFFLVGMVLVAATVGLQSSRSGVRVIYLLAGVSGGFLLYAIGEVLRDLGGNGIVDPAMSAWIPCAVSVAVGATLLLFQEDG